MTFFTWNGDLEQNCTAHHKVFTLSAALTTKLGWRWSVESFSPKRKVASSDQSKLNTCLNGNEARAACEAALLDYLSGSDTCTVNECDKRCVNHFPFCRDHYEAYRVTYDKHWELVFWICAYTKPTVRTTVGSEGVIREIYHVLHKNQISPDCIKAMNIVDPTLSGRILQFMNHVKETDYSYIPKVIGPGLDEADAKEYRLRSKSLCELWLDETEAPSS